MSMYVDLQGAAAPWVADAGDENVSVVPGSRVQP